MMPCARCGKHQSRYLIQDTDKQALDPALPSLRVCGECGRLINRKPTPERSKLIQALLRGEKQKRRGQKGE
jgi:hypothetical protein